MELISQLISNDIISAIGWTLINITWQGSIIAFLLWIFLKIFNKSSAQFKYSISILSLATIVALSVYNFYDSYQTTTMAVATPDIVISNDYNLLVGLSQLISESQSSFSLNDFFLGFAQQLENYLPVIVTIWIVGIILFMLRFLIGYSYLHRVRRHNVSTLGENWIKKFYAIESKLNIKKRIKYLESRVVKIPMMLGYLKPVIIIPAGILTGIPENQIEAIIAHELAHIRRNDYLVNIFQIFIEIVFFYHPAVWYISSAIRAERENCCDDIALTTCDGSITYAKALVSVQELKPGKVYSAVAFSGQKKQLLNRIKRMVMKTEMKSNVSDRIIATLIVSIGIIIAGLSVSFSANSTENTNVIVEDTALNTESTSIVFPEVKANQNVNKLTQKDTTIIKRKGKADHIEIDSKTIIRDFTDKDGKRKNIKFTLENGNVTEMYVDGKKVPEKEYKTYQPVVDETIDDLKKAKVEIIKAMKVIKDIDTEEIQKEVEVAMKNIHIEMDSINKEVERSLKEIKVIKLDSIMKDVEIGLMSIQKINLDSILIDVQKSISDIKHVDMEEVKKQMEETRKEIDNIDFEKIRKEIEINWSETMKDVDKEAIMKEMERVRNELANIDWEKIKVEFEQNYNSFDKEKTLKDMEKELQKLEGLELEKK